MSTKQTIALCIPAYNAAKLLPALLSSAKNQSFPFNEILVYNDCSSDTTVEVARQYGATVVNGDVNRGCSTGKNRLAEIAKSDWLHFHDADDDLLPNFTQVAHKWMNKNNAPDIVVLHYEYRVAGTNKYILEPSYNVAKMKEDPVRFSITNKLVNFAIIKKGSFLRIGGFNTDPDVLYNEDRAFYTRATIHGLTLDYEPELTCINYYQSGSMSVSNKAKCAKASYYVWKYVIENTNGNYKKEIAFQLLENAAYAATADDWDTVKKSITDARKLDASTLPGGSKYFKLLFKVAPFSSFYWREKIIRHLTSKRKKAE